MTNEQAKQSWDSPECMWQHIVDRMDPPRLKAFLAANYIALMRRGSVHVDQLAERLESLSEDSSRVILAQHVLDELADADGSSLEDAERVALTRLRVYSGYNPKQKPATSSAT